MNAVLSPEQIEPDPIEIDPRACQLCGLTIDRHEMVDFGDGPLFFCPDVDDGVADTVRRWELADPRDAWRHTGEAPPAAEVRNSRLDPKPQPYRTADSTVDAFWFVVRLGDTDRLREWLDNHPKDAPALLELLEGK